MCLFHTPENLKSRGEAAEKGEGEGSRQLPSELGRRGRFLERDVSDEGFSEEAFTEQFLQKSLAGGLAAGKKKSSLRVVLRSSEEILPSTPKTEPRQRYSALFVTTLRVKWGRNEPES